MTDKVGNELIELFKRNFKEFKFNDSRGEILVRCRFCGDSIHLSSAHFYVNIGSYNRPPVYHCFKCGASGILTPSVLLDLLKDDILDDEDYNAIADLGKSLKSKITRMNLNMNSSGRHVHRVIYNSPIKNKSILKPKLDYLNSRLGLNLSIEEYQKNKVIFSIKDFLYKNSIPFTRKENIMEELDEYFVGFLSLDNGFIILRNVNDTNGFLSDHRYVNYNIFNSYTNHMRYYCIPNTINILKGNSINIHIAEGCFDILSILYNLRKEKENNIYIASNGKGYYAVAKLLLDRFGIYNPIFHFYPDKDVSNEELNWYIRKLYDMNYQIHIHRNSYDGEKDFGVPKDRIKEVIIQ